MTELRCGSCVHFKDGPAHPKFGDLCESLGTRDYAQAPDCYSPSPIKIVRADVNVSRVGALLRHLTGEQMQVLGQLITQSADLEELGLKFGQPLYVNLGGAANGKTYLTCYFKGFVVGTVSTKVGRELQKHVYLASDLSVGADLKLEHRTLLRLSPESLLKQSEFDEVRAELVADGMLEATKANGGVKGWKMPLGQWFKAGCPHPLPEDPKAYEPPSLDTAPSDWLEPFTVDELDSAKETKRKKRVRAADTPEDVKRKQQERAGKKIKIEKTVNEDGTTTRTIKITKDEEDEEQPEFELFPNNEVPKLPACIR